MVYETKTKFQKYTKPQKRSYGLLLSYDASVTLPRANTTRPLNNGVKIILFK